MKPRQNRLRKQIVLASSAVLVCGPLHASVLAWDADGGTTGPQDGSGTWTTGAGGWWDGAANDNWADGDQAVFGAGTDGAYAIAIDGPLVTANGSATTGGTLALNTTGGQAIAGDISLNSTSSSRTYLRLLQSNQIASTAALGMELKGSGNVYAEIALQGNSQTLAAIHTSWDATVGSGSTIFIENRVFNDNGGGDGGLTINGASDSNWGCRVQVRNGQSGNAHYRRRTQPE